MIENWLKENNIKYIYNFELKMNVVVRKSNIILADFYIPSKNCIIEYNGRQHYIPIEYFGGEIAFEEQKNRDLILEKYCNKNSIKLLIIKYD